MTTKIKINMERFRGKRIGGIWQPHGKGHETGETQRDEMVG